MERWVAERKLFATLPPARELRKAGGSGRIVRIRCDRSLPYEFVGEFLDAYLATWGARQETSLSDYDPALSQLEAAAGHDVRILFLDWRLTRMSPPEAAAWLAERARTALRLAPRAPVLVNNWPEHDALNAELQKLDVPGLFIIDLDAVR